ncbi:heme lyase CcmF/NrfE family subunit, partial [Amycolatopsis rhizosphaerae]
LVAWTFLTAGIVLGAWWSYAVLGWGGYWAWDPVENASLLPWLTATAALHLTLPHRRAGLTGWAVTLYSSTFLLVLLGTFLTRSGAVASVHSFTASPLGPMLLGFVLLVAAVVTGLLIRRAGTFGPAAAAPGLSRERVLLANGLVFAVLTAVVLTGTVFPLLAQGLTGRRLSVGPGYFDRTAVPIALAALLLMGAGPLVRPRADSPGALCHRLAVPVLAALAAIAVTGLLARPGMPALIAFGAAAFVLAGLGRVLAGEVRAVWSTGRPVLPALLRRRRWGGLLAHAGIAVAIVGIAASGAGTVHAEAGLAVGQSVTVDGVTATLTGVDRAAGAGRMTASARFRLDRRGSALGSAEAALHYYPARDTTVSVPAIRSRPEGDVYLTVTGVAADGQHATVRLSVDPLVGLLWAGGAITALGGLLSLIRPKAGPGVPLPPRVPSVPSSEASAA